MIYATDNDDKEVKKFVDRSLEVIEEQGVENLIMRINAKSMNHNNSYLFVVDKDGNIVAHGANVEYVGQNYKNAFDNSGRMLVQRIIRAGIMKPEGNWVKYYMINPASNDPEKKKSYVRKHENYIIGAGHYFN